MNIVDFLVQIPVVKMFKDFVTTGLGMKVTDIPQSYYICLDESGAQSSHPE